jgi:Zn-dependent peptidase ImmA (M78 family)
MANDEFKIDDAKIEKISKGFQVSKEIVEILHKAYRIFSPYFQGQYLAHAMRGIECYVRNKTKDNRFIVICEPYKEGEFYPKQKQAVCYYYPSKTVIRSYDKQANSFIINYNRDLPEKERRDYIGHEIGHLFLITLLKDKTETHFGPFTENEEAISSIFGIFAMSEKNDFYANYDTAARNHKDWQELFDFYLNKHK